MFNETPVVSSTRWALLRLIGICTTEQEQEQQHRNTAAAAAAAGTALAGGSLATAKDPRETEGRTHKEHPSSCKGCLMLGPGLHSTARACTGKLQGCSMSHRSWCLGWSITQNMQLQLTWAVQQAKTLTSLSSHKGMLACAAVWWWVFGRWQEGGMQPSRFAPLYPPKCAALG